MKLFAAIAFVLTLLLPFTTKAFNFHSTPDSVAIDTKAPEFKLKDFSGKIVTLSSLKGKIVILDFWATWCLPCHQNFPAMKKIVNNFKKDSSVVFLFIDTRERTTDYINLAKADMERNSYNFHVLFDEFDSDGIQNKYYKTLGMAGIPTQFILDGQGIIRHKQVGFDPRLTDEQRVAIELKLIESVKSKQ